MSKKDKSEMGYTPAKARKLLVRYPRFKELHETIRECQEDSIEAGEPSCLAIEGMTGTGKSTLVKTYAQAFPRYETETGTVVPVFYMETPSPVTVKGMAQNMLRALGDPGARYGDTTDLDWRLIDLLDKCRVELIILDDFHHLTNVKTPRTFKLVSDWLKVLIKESEKPFLVVGTVGEVKQILESNEQLNRLFVIEPLKPFEWNMDKPKKTKEFVQLVGHIEEGLGMGLSWEINRNEYLYLVYFATNGMMCHISRLLRQAAKYAHKSGSEGIDKSHLVKAYDKWIASKVNKANPFKEPEVALAQMDQPEPRSTTSTNKKKREKPSEVFKVR